MDSNPVPNCMLEDASYRLSRAIDYHSAVIRTVSSVFNTVRAAEGMAILDVIGNLINM